MSANTYFEGYKEIPGLIRTFACKGYDPNEKPEEGDKIYTFNDMKEFCRRIDELENNNGV